MGCPPRTCATRDHIKGRERARGGKRGGGHLHHSRRHAEGRGGPTKTARGQQSRLATRHRRRRRGTVHQHKGSAQCGAVADSEADTYPALLWGKRPRALRPALSVACKTHRTQNDCPTIPSCLVPASPLPEEHEQEKSIDSTPPRACGGLSCHRRGTLDLVGLMKACVRSLLWDAERFHLEPNAKLEEEGG